MQLHFNRIENLGISIGENMEQNKTQSAPDLLISPNDIEHVNIGNLNGAGQCRCE